MWVNHTEIRCNVKILNTKYLQCISACPSARFVRLTTEEDVRLRGIEQNPLLKPKVRLRAQVLRLCRVSGERGAHRRLLHRSQLGKRLLRDLVAQGLSGLSVGHSVSPVKICSQHIS